MSKLIIKMRHMLSKIIFMVGDTFILNINALTYNRQVAILKLNFILT